MRRGAIRENDADSGDFEQLNFVSRKHRSNRNSDGQASTSRATTSTTIPVRGAARRKTTPRQRILKQFREIKKLQNTTNFLIPRASFGRLLREISLGINPDIVRYTAAALEALQEATEMFIVQILQDSYLLTMHRKCVTLSKADLMLIRSLKLHF